jgi:hypothetical protein
MWVISHPEIPPEPFSGCTLPDSSIAEFKVHHHEFLRSLKLLGGQGGRKKTQGIRQTFDRLARITSVDRKLGYHPLPMAHNVPDGRVAW